ncbi:hypothetical protein [Halomonas garicola]|uniref:hypothetical protein n=1 Tax=Halomonas garicola TaxID=1690008 RepID=UPI00289653A6|nr:hypothetical protein [Halomonas garicola]
MGAHGLLLGLAAWVVGLCLGFIAATVCAALGALWLWQARRREPRGTLEVSVDETSVQGRFLPVPSTALPPVWAPLECDYLGPWLAGLRLGGKRLWLWPDSAPADARRRLRRVFHRPGS